MLRREDNSLTKDKPAKSEKVKGGGNRRKQSGKSSRRRR
jgi:hypothetical protein